jgi:DNA-binding XRE family transcriptional regulator
MTIEEIYELRANLFKQMRKDAGLIQDEIATHIKKDRVWVVKFENGSFEHHRKLHCITEDLWFKTCLPRLSQETLSQARAYLKHKAIGFSTYAP